MKTSRAFAVGGAAAALLTAGWALTPKDAEATAYSASSSTDATTDSSASATDGSTADPTDGSGSDSSSSTDEAADSGTSATTAPSTATDSSTDSSDGTYTGSAVQTRYGVYQVEITVAGGQVTDVALVQEGANDRESQQIKSRSLPQLIQEVLSTQSSDVSYISGASYTSDGFARSVADAFDQAGL